MNKKQIDMLNGSLWDKILLFALPLAFTGILQQLFNAADIAVIGQFVNADAMAAVGSNAPLISLLVNFFVGISLGSNVVIANAIGSRDNETVEKAVHTSILIALIGGIFISVVGEIIAEPMLHLLGVPEQVFPMSLLYLRYYMAGMPIILLYNFESAIYRSAGNTRTPLITLVVSGIINVVLNLFFVIVLKKTVDGVAMATVISNFISVVILFIGLIKTDTAVRVDIHKMGIDKMVLSKILRIGVPSGVQSMTFSAANLVVQSAINSLGNIVMAGSAAALNIEIFAYYMLNSFGQACTTFVGQNNGAKKPERCRKTLMLCLVEDMLLTFTEIAIILFFGKNLLWIFNKDPEVIASGYTRLIYMFSAYIFSLISEVMSGYMRGYGLSAFPALISLVGICGTRILWIAKVFKASPTFENIMIVYPISLGLTAVAVCICVLVLRPDKLYERKFKKQKP
ncbi:MAG: MATE family efflux transporter [Firmicutes bacterium]|nr:MATE family efflux transporter [Bacillota bacterium]